MAVLVDRSHDAVRIGLAALARSASTSAGNDLHHLHDRAPSDLVLTAEDQTGKGKDAMQEGLRGFDLFVFRGEGIK